MLTKSLLKPALALLLASLLFWGCDGETDSLINNRLQDNPVPPEEAEADAGDADFSTFITIGNSLTAGFKDAALYDLGQSYSLGAQLAGQLQAAGAQESFNQPLINSANGFNASASNPEAGVILGRFKLDPNIPGPSPLVEGELPAEFSGDRSSLHNFGVPGVTAGELLTPQTAASNPFYGRFASAPGSSTILGDAIAANPSFFTLWIGNNDVLRYATGGASDPEALTATADFGADFETIIENLMSQTEAKGVVANIPPVLAIPFFRAVPFNAVELDEETAAQLNAGLATLNEVYDGMAETDLLSFSDFTEEDRDERAVSYQAGANPVLINDPDLADIGYLFDLLASLNQITDEQRAALEPYRQARPMREGELLTFGAASVLGTLANPENPTSQIGVVIPLSNQFTLTANQIIEVETARQTFNGIMQSVVDATNENFPENRLAFYNTNEGNSTFRDIFGLDDSGVGTEVGSVALEPDFSPGGVFSTDGIHPNARGTALVANDFIEAIEAGFNATIPPLSDQQILNLPSVQLCAGDCVSQQSLKTNDGLNGITIRFNEAASYMAPPALP